jgi:hypothetical protein
MRTLTVNTTNKTVQRLASEPILILQIDWSTGTLYYGDKTFTLSGNPVTGKVLQFSPIQATGKQDTSGEISSANVTLDDVDGTLKVIYNTLIVPGTVVTAYHHYEGNLWTDKTLVFKGKISGTVQWEEGERQLSFDIESLIEDVEVGYAPEEGEIVGQNPDTYGVMWPIVFGGVRRLKAVPLFSGAIGNNTDGIYGGWPYLDATPFQVEGGDKYPQNTSLDIVVYATRFHGHFEGNTFHRDISNMPWFENVPLAVRDSGDPDATSPYVCWVTPGYNLARKQCWLGAGKQFNYCSHQEGNKCFFNFSWDHLPNETETFVEVRGCVASYWYSDPTWLNYWYIKPGSNVYQYGVSASALYIVNEYPSTQVVEVYAWRTYDGSRVFVPVPSSYFTVHLSYAIGARNVTAIEFPTPLNQHDGEDWESDIYVSVRSILSSNTSDAIKWLVQTYTSYSVDTASFDSVKVDVAPYPANFALFNKQNVMALIEEIAWQARCAIYSHNGTISIKYLSKELSSVYSITTTDVLLKSLKLLFTSIEDVYTKLVGTWRIDYTDEKLSVKKIIYSNNVAAFGLRELEKDVYIYNIEELAKMTIYFWGYRYSNSWRIAEYPTLLRTLALELFDCVAHLINIISTNSIRGVLEDVSHDSASNEITIRAQLASKAGQHVAGQPVEDPYYWIGDPAYVVTPRTIVDPLNGLTLVNYVPPTIPTTGGTNGQGGGTGTETGYKYVFILPTQDEIERGVNFPVKIQLQTTAGARVNNTVSARLSLHSEDTGDVLTTGVIEKNITLTNGEYSVTNEQITGGTTTQYSGSLSCVDALLRSDYTAGTSEYFSITNVKTGVLTWTTSPPATVQRGVPFSVGIGGGVAGQTFQISFVGGDAADAIYDGETAITTVTLGGGGTYSGTWNISGGSGADVGIRIKIHDYQYSTYADAVTSLFNISSISIVKKLVQSLVVTQNIIADAPQLEITFISGVMMNDTIFRLRFRLLDSNGAVIDYDEEVNIWAYDGAGNLVNWLYPGAVQYFNDIMTDGVWEGDYKISIPGGTVEPITVYAELMYGGVPVTGQLDIDIFEMDYNIILPANCTRGVPFNITIQALNVDDQVDTSYIPNNVVLTPVSSDPADVVTPISISNGLWVLGEVTIPWTLTGGAGVDNLHFNLTDGYGTAITSLTMGIGTTTTAITPDFWTASWSGVDSWGTETESTFNSAINFAHTAMIGASRVVNTSIVGLGTTIYKGAANDWNYGGGDRTMATAAIYVNRYHITDPQKAGAMSLRLTLQIMGAVGYPDQYVSDYGSRYNQGTMRIGYSATEPLTYNDLLTTQILAGIKINYGGYVGYHISGYMSGPSTWVDYPAWTHSTPPYTPAPVINYVTIDIPTAFLQSMIGNKLYIWALKPDYGSIYQGSGKPISDSGYDGFAYWAAAAIKTHLMEINA